MIDCLVTLVTSGFQAPAASCWAGICSVFFIQRGHRRRPFLKRRNIMRNKESLESTFEY
ncbi:hypothetical protein LEMLEM_LOCUS1742 [Lemmus lemmus]